MLDHAAELAGRRRTVEAEDLDRLARPCLLHLLAAVVVERAHLAGRVPGDDRIADPQRAALDEHRRHWAPADVEPRLDDRPRRVGLRVGGQLELGVGDEENALEQLFEVQLLLRRDLRELRRAAPVLGLQPLGSELALDAVGVRVRKIDLVDRDDDRDAGGARVGDRLPRLRHDAVVCGDDEHGDIRHLGAAGAHRRERLVARGVEERHLATVDVRLVRADVLRDPARLGLDDRCLADRVEQRRLAVVDMAHDRHDRRARHQIRRGVLEDLRLVVVVGGVLDRHLTLELGGDQVDLVVAERLRDRLALSQSHQERHDLGRRDPERLGEVLDRDARLDRHRPGRLARRLLARLAGPVPRSRAARTSRPRAAPPFDDHAPLPPPVPPRGLIGLLGLFGPSAISFQCRGTRAQARRRLSGAERG